jgi:6,7-dimethyl-8-ribityllumazine synthase
MSKIRILEAGTEVQDAQISILVTRWNSFITDNLLRAAVSALTRNGVAEENIEIVRVPGAFELPIAAQKIADQTQPDAIVALGCVIRGGTPHFEYVSAGCMDGLMRVQLDTGIPLTFGVLTVDNVDQAAERSGDDANNKGEEAALTSLEMINLLRSASA